MFRLLRVPVARGHDRQPCRFELADISIQHRHHLISARNRQGAAGTEIVLHIDNQEGISFLHHHRLS